MRRFWVFSLLPMLAFLAACQSTPENIKHAVNAYYLGDYPTAANILKPETVKKDENFVLNNCRFGSAVIALGDVETANNAFMAAYEVINGVNTNTGGRTLGATLVFEGIKVWKGEPFERAMAHYYLGMVNLIKNDYSNARAAFQNSIFNLAAYEGDKPDAKNAKPVQSDFALGYFGLGLCYLREGKAEHADANFKLAVKYQPSLSPLVAEISKPTTNTLLFVDYGQGPRRHAKGWYNEESAFYPTPAEAGAIPQANLFIDGKQTATVTMRTWTVDTLLMAQQQKWQDIDTIRKVKAAVGTGAMAAGAGVAAYGAHRGDTGTALAGLGIMAVGAALAASSQADIRYWEMLPRAVYIMPASLPPGEHTFQVQAGASTSAPFKVTIKPAGQGDTVLYVRLR